MNYYKKYSILLFLNMGARIVATGKKILKKGRNYGHKKGFMNKTIVQKPFENRLTEQLR